MDKIPTLTYRNPNQLIRDIGGRIRSHRLARGWTQAELAERSGVSISTLKLLEREGKGSLQRLAKIAVILGLESDLSELFSSPPAVESIDQLESKPRLRGSRRS
ncbi:helix-turn-helix transcriptional regulator [Haloferula rosea]|uniref:Helix-turn-helix transcriptional regulator n=1 Tax=Haloferula rosea TaxID=490093 RepID=A0A934R661_9BACT|nr:helix-turn-helix transcriptional regulator [Haloferula rosea]MBK1826019.1 helix-turn-helix transcriptional regulator [Haloferula rosea]